MRSYLSATFGANDDDDEMENDEYTSAAMVDPSQFNNSIEQATATYQSLKRMKYSTNATGGVAPTGATTSTRPGD